MTYVAVALLRVGVLLMVAAGISPLAGGPPLDVSQLVADLARSSRRLPVAGPPGSHRDADQPGHRRGGRVRLAGDRRMVGVAVAILVVIAIGVAIGARDG